MDPGADDAPPQLNAVPFVLALVAFLVVAVLAWTYLRDDDDVTVVRPDGIEVLDVAGDDLIDVTALDQPGCRTVERAQVDIGVDRIFVEMVLADEPGCVEAPRQDLTATVQLPEAIGDRDVVPGIGRFQIPCDADLRCRPDR